MRITGIHHVQIAIPPGCDDLARAFYGQLLGLPEAPKPPTVSHQGVWYEDGPVRIHLGVDPDFTAARKAHVGLVVTDLQRLVDLLRSQGFPVAEAAPLGGYERVHVHDPFGNRVELMAPRAPAP